jgi:hypothetical protein
MPTVLDTAGVRIPEEVQGMSLLPLTRNESEEWPEETFIQFWDGFMSPGRAVLTRR